MSVQTLWREGWTSFWPTIFTALQATEMMIISTIVCSNQKIWRTRPGLWGHSWIQACKDTNSAPLYYSSSKIFHLPLKSRKLEPVPRRNSKARCQERGNWKRRAASGAWDGCFRTSLYSSSWKQSANSNCIPCSAHLCSVNGQSFSAISSVIVKTSRSRRSQSRREDCLESPVIDGHNEQLIVCSSKSARV